MTLAYTNYCQLYIRNICADFDHNPSLEVQGNFLDISKAIDKDGMKVYYTNLNLLIFQEIFLTYIFRSFLKGLCYKTITSQNVSAEAQIKNFFIL